MKHLGVGQLVSQHQVAPSRGRGLKHLGEIYGCSESGRPFTGAWIETWVDEQEKVEAKGRPFTGAWIETVSTYTALLRMVGRPFTGAWIETGRRRRRHD